MKIIDTHHVYRSYTNWKLRIPVVDILVLVNVNVMFDSVAVLKNNKTGITLKRYNVSIPPRPMAWKRKFWALKGCCELKEIACVAGGFLVCFFFCVS